MPQFVLRTDDETLKSLAPYKVLSVMFHPRSRKKREGLMVHVLANSNAVGVKRRRASSRDEFFSDSHIGSHQGFIAGYLLLTRLQLHLNGQPSSLNRAIPIVRSFIPDWQQPTGSTWPKDSFAHSWPRGRQNMLKAWAQFRSVAHLWAALIHIGQHHVAFEQWRWGHDLPTFLALAETFRQMACAVSSSDDQRFVLPRKKAWNFVLPPHAKVTKPLLALPLNQRQLTALQRARAA